MKKYLFILWCVFVLSACRHDTDLAFLRQEMEHRSVEVLQERLADGMDANARDEQGQTPLFTIDSAADRENTFSLAQARLLVQHGADVNARDKLGNTPILALPGVISEKYYDDEGEVDAPMHLLDYYISCGADVFARNEAGHNALDLALIPPHYSDNPFMVKKLKKLGLKSTLDRELVWCAAMSDVAGVRRLLAAGANPNACSVDGIPALIAAMGVPVLERPHAVEIVELLLQAGADPNAAENSRFNLCALLYARWNPPQVARLLLKYGADAKGLPVYDYNETELDPYVELMRKHGAVIIKYEAVNN